MRSRARNWHRDGDRGSATVLGLAVLGLLVALLIAFLTIGAVTVAAHQARTSADLGGVAAAQVLLVGGTADQACARAADLAVDNGAELTDCRVDTPATLGADESGPRVSVTVRRPTGLSVWPEVTARAEAGLVTARP